MAFPSESSPMQQGLDPRVLDLIAQMQSQHMDESQITDLLSSVGVDPSAYQDNVGIASPASVPDLANLMSPPAASGPYMQDPDAAPPDDPGMDHTGGGKRPGSMPPPQQPPFWPNADNGGVPPGLRGIKGRLPTPTAGDTPPLTVADTINPGDPAAELAKASAVAPDTKVNVSVDPPPDDSAFGRMSRVFGDSDLSKALMATGFGILGAKGTYGNTGSAIGQGGMYGLASMEKSQARKDALAEKRAESQAKDKLATSAQQIQKDKNANDVANRNEQRMGDRAKAVLNMIDNGNADSAMAAIEADPALRAYIGLPQGALLKNKPQSEGGPLAQIEAGILGKMTADEQKQYMLHKGGGEGNADSPNAQFGVIMKKFTTADPVTGKQGFDNLTPSESLVMSSHLQDPDMAAALKTAYDPTGPYWQKITDGKMTDAQIADTVAMIARQSKLARQRAAGSSGGSGDQAAAKANVLGQLGVKP